MVLHGGEGGLRKPLIDFPRRTMHFRIHLPGH